ncbi:MAG: phosphotransferase [Spirochaetales bacterium]|nr:phosphotransferase [Spirochaetales bacterium]
MKITNIDVYELIAEGGQSRIYNFDETKIIRVPKRESDYERIKYEYDVYKSLEDMVNVPKVYEIVDYKDIPCLIMEKITGNDLFFNLKKNLFNIFTLPKILATLHSELFQISINNTFENNHNKAIYCISKSTSLSSEIKSILLERLNTLEFGSVLCHGDFHPGNIIEANNHNYIIDWSSATIGSPLFDIAHTFLLLMNIPKLNNVSDTEHNIQKKFTRYLGKKYLRLVCKQNNISINSLFPYILIKAGERSYYGIDNEKNWLVKFIENTIHEKSINVLKLEKYA